MHLVSSGSLGERVTKVKGRGLATPGGWPGRSGSGSPGEGLAWPGRFGKSEGGSIFRICIVLFFLVEGFVGVNGNMLVELYQFEHHVHFFGVSAGHNDGQVFAVLG